MKINNISPVRIYLKDLRLTQTSQTEGRRGEDQYVEPSDSVYVPDTSEVLRSVYHGDLFKFMAAGKITINDRFTLPAYPGPGNSITLTHSLNYPPNVVVLKQVSSTYVDATATYDLVHSSDFTSLTITNTTAFTLTYLVRIG